MPSVQTIKSLNNLSVKWTPTDFANSTQAKNAVQIDGVQIYLLIYLGPDIVLLLRKPRDSSSLRSLPSNHSQQLSSIYTLPYVEIPTTPGDDENTIGSLARLHASFLLGIPSSFPDSPSLLPKTQYAGHFSAFEHQDGASRSSSPNSPNPTSSVRRDKPHSSPSIAQSSSPLPHPNPTSVKKRSHLGVIATIFRVTSPTLINKILGEIAEDKAVWGEGKYVGLEALTRVQVQEMGGGFEQWEGKRLRAGVLGGFEFKEEKVEREKGVKEVEEKAKQGVGRKGAEKKAVKAVKKRAEKGLDEKGLKGRVENGAENTLDKEVGKGVKKKVEESVEKSAGKVMKKGSKKGLKRG